MVADATIAFSRIGDIQGIEQAPPGGCELFEGQWQSFWAWLNGAVEAEGIETATSRGPGEVGASP